jgi:hypothetical protein
MTSWSTLRIGLGQILGFGKKKKKIWDDQLVSTRISFDQLVNDFDVN